MAPSFLCMLALVVGLLGLPSLAETTCRNAEGCTGNASAEEGSFLQAAVWSHAPVSLASQAQNASPSSGNYLPVFFVHGVNSGEQDAGAIERAIQRHNPGTWFKAIPLFQNWDSIGSTNMMGQIHNGEGTYRAFIEKCVKDEPAVFKDGFHLVCHSQGGLTCRGLISMWDGHMVKSFISLAGPQQGVVGFKGYEKHIPESVRTLIVDGMFYHQAVQNWLTIANYWKDMSQHTDYLQWSDFLAVINNEAPSYESGKRCQHSGLFCAPSGMCHIAARDLTCIMDLDKIDTGFNANPNYVTNLLALKHAIFFGSPADKTIVPWQSSVWGYYKEGSTENSEDNIVNYSDTSLGLKNLVPLQQMIDDGRAKLIVKDGIEHTHWYEKEEIVDWYIEYLY